MLAHLSAPHGGWPIYPGNCRNREQTWGPIEGKLPSWRLRMPNKQLQWPELGAEINYLDGESQVGDVVLRRADGFIAYHLATALDELWMGINTVVRGCDLQISTGPQVAIIELLQQQSPQYWHVPLLLNEDGEKLSKGRGAQGLTSWRMEGGSAAELIGMFAARNGWVPVGSKLSAKELLKELKNNPAKFRPKNQKR